MYELFTDRARKVMQLANQEAQRFNHHYIGTEHLLLGLLKEGSGVAANVLKNLGLDLRMIRVEVEKIIEPAPQSVAPGRLPHTLRAKGAIDHAVEEARNLGHSYVGTEHILLGLAREVEGVASGVLANLGLKAEAVRAEVMLLLGRGAAQSNTPEPEQVRPNLPEVVLIPAIVVQLVPCCFSYRGMVITIAEAAADTHPQADEPVVVEKS